MQQQQMTEATTDYADYNTQIEACELSPVESQTVAEPPQMQEERTADIAMLLHQMNSLSRTTRERAAKQARELTPIQLLAVLQAGGKLYRLRKRRGTGIELVAVLGWFPLCLTLLCSTDLSVSAIMLSFWPLLVGVLGWHCFYIPVRLSRGLLTLLKETEDLHLLGPAISMYVHPDELTEMHRAVGTKLDRLLPQLRADQAGLLSREQKRDLLLLVAQQAPIGLRVSGLKALEQIGDESAYPTVRNLSLFSPDRQVKEAAAKCLEYLEQHAGERREMQTLLRASDSTMAVTPDTLLRPAVNHAAMPSDQLLRPQA